jgi:hypothetical protein
MAKRTNSQWRLFAIALVLLCGQQLAAQDAIALGDRRELFVDTHLIDRIQGARLEMHAPQPREIVLKTDHPWEGIYSAYFTVLQDGDLYRMYYRGMPEPKHNLDTEVTCYAESKDGIHWTKPKLGLFEVKGTKENNVILARHRACHNFAPFIDTHPKCPPDQRYKALGGTGKPGLIAFVSPDGIHWKEIQKDPVITKGAFDSQNVAFWSETENCYLCYFRVFRDGKRWIARAASQDFMNWTEPEDMGLDGKDREHLYTNQTVPYVRAPHIYLGTPTRFFPGRKALTAETFKRLGTPEDFKFANDCADIVFTSTRGGTDMKRTFLEAFIRPGPDPRNWTSRANYAARGILQTSPTELSIYVQHNLGYPTSHIKRYALRLDGFVSVKAMYAGGEMLTKPFTFTGKNLTLNYATSAGGGVRVEIQSADGKPIPGYALADCPEIIGDETDRTVSWKAGADVSALTGREIRLRFVMKDADLYSLRFVK